VQTRVQKWGNSLALRIPKAFAAAARLEANSVVEVSVEDGKLVLTPVRPKYTLEELLKGVTPENVHPEWDTGPAMGNEAW
jgi:antitoxin MazE